LPPISLTFTGLPASRTNGQDPLVVRRQRLGIEVADTGRDQQHRPAAHLRLRQHGRQRQVLAEALLTDPLHDALSHHQLVTLNAHISQPLDQLLRQQIQLCTPSGDPTQHHRIPS
jgi:hypothetical protein